MTDDVVEAMARGWSGFTEKEWAKLSLEFRRDQCTCARAAIRALHERSGLVVARMPGPLVREEPLLIPTVEDGWNAALVAVRAAAVEVEG